jgi:putative N-acetylmannosamine-6-phosphate epimerase/predicted NBD/HSP70 family sugar kinase
MSTIREQLKGKLVVSCQAAPGDPLEDTETIRRIARAVVGAGAECLRVNSAEHIAAIRQDSQVPIIGIQKCYKNGTLRITPDLASAAALAAAGATIIALDCTNRTWTYGESWQELIRRIHSELKHPVMADVATLQEALAAVEAGADFVGTTLNGYTEETRNNHSFSWSLLAELNRRIHVPIVAEGHISTPDEARRAIAGGAWCVVVGSAITRPGTIAGGFLRALRPAETDAPAIGVDLGGTSIKAGLVDRNGQVTLLAQVPTEASRGRETIAANMATAIEKVLGPAREAGIVPCGLGIASAGAMNVDDGRVFAATDNLPGWAGFDLRGFAEKRFHLSTRIINDAHAAVVAELHFGLGRSLSDFVAITVGTGVGGGVVSSGRLIQGQHGFAGTIGHHTIRMDGRLCNCGRHGCLEAYVSTAALLREYKEQSGNAISAPDLTDDAVAFEISRLARAGDAAALKAYRVLAGYLAEGIANIFNLLDPQAVLLSGGLVEGHSGFVADVEKRVTKLLHFGEKRAPRVELATGGYCAGVQGAGALLFSEPSL